MQFRHKEGRQGKHLPSKAMRGSLAEGRDKMTCTFSEAGNCSNMALSTHTTRVNRSLSNNLNLVGPYY